MRKRRVNALYPPFQAQLSRIRFRSRSFLTVSWYCFSPQYNQNAVPSTTIIPSIVSNRHHLLIVLIIEGGIFALIPNSAQPAKEFPIQFVILVSAARNRIAGIHGIIG